MFKPGGKHVFLDVWVQDIPDGEIMKKIMADASEIAGSQVLHNNIEYFDKDNSYTCVLMLSESHASVHTWPEHNFMAFDFFFCGKANDDAAIRYIADNLDYTKINVKKHLRGET